MILRVFFCDEAYRDSWPITYIEGGEDGRGGGMTCLPRLGGGGGGGGVGGGGGGGGLTTRLSLVIPLVVIYISAI